MASQGAGCAEDPGSAGEAARAGHFRWTSASTSSHGRRVLAPEEAVRPGWPGRWAGRWALCCP